MARCDYVNLPNRCPDLKNEMVRVGFAQLCIMLHTYEDRTGPQVAFTTARRQTLALSVSGLTGKVFLHYSLSRCKWSARMRD